MSKPKEVEPIEIPVQSVRRATCEQTYKEYKSVQKIGGGEFGDIYLMCNEAKKCPYVIKVIEIDPKDEDRTIAKFEQEVIMQLAAAELNIAPEVYDAWICDTEGKGRRYHYKEEWHPVAFQGFIVMDRMDGDLKTYVKSHEITEKTIETIVNKVKHLVTKLHSFGIEHRDIHHGNVFYKGKKWYLGDFGLSRFIGGPKEKDDNRDERNDNKGPQRIEAFLRDPSPWMPEEE